MLTEISFEQIPVLKDLFLQEWPKYISSYCSLDNYYNWILKDSSLKENIKFLGIDLEWKRHGTFVILISEDKFTRIHCGNLDTEEAKTSLKKTLALLNFNKIINFSPFDISVKSTVLNSIDRSRFFITFEGTADFYHLSKEEARKFDNTGPSDVTFKSLDNSHAKIVDDYWPGKWSGSLELVKQLIMFNDTLGAFNEVGELVAWILKREYGTIGMLHVMDNQRKRGLGTLLTKMFVKQQGDRNQDITVSIFLDNIPSMKIFTKLGFKKIGQNYRFAMAGKN